MIEPIPCATGSYASSEGSTSCTQCPQGSRCPDPTADPIACLAGEYQSSYGQTSCRTVSKKSPSTCVSNNSLATATIYKQMMKFLQYSLLFFSAQMVFTQPLLVQYYVLSVQRIIDVLTLISLLQHAVVHNMHLPDLQPAPHVLLDPLVVEEQSPSAA